MTPYRVFLTGEPGCGKTTAVKRTCKLLTEQGWKVGGVISGEIRERGIRVGFDLEDLTTCQIGFLAHVNQKDGPRVGKYRVNLNGIQRIAVTAIQRSIEESDLIVVDEIGPMELHSTPFISAIEEALSSQKPFIGTIHKRASHSLVTAIKANFAYQILEVTGQNRDNIPGILAERMERQKGMK